MKNQFVSIARRSFVCTTLLLAGAVAGLGCAPEDAPVDVTTSAVQGLSGDGYSDTELLLNGDFR